jgi:uncharacterized protein YprB with RNaseH-like and TPR domain
VSGLASRLREIVRSTGRPEGRPLHDEEAHGTGRPSGRPIATGDPNVVAETLGGSWAEAHGQRYLVVDRSYNPGYRHGCVAMMDCLPPWPRLSLLCGPESRACSDHREQLLFIDLETTGLAGGAGTYAFLVGCAWFDGPTFRIRQFFLSAYAGERALLDGLAQLAHGSAGVVSFNGKSFDLPLIETRYLFHRRQTPFAGLPHVDMLHPARRLWRSEEDEAAGMTASCRLSVLEQAVCGVTREADVPGFEIPARYFNYVRSGDARPLERVFEHNRLDLISLALLTAEASRLLDEGPAAARTAREALGLGRLYERGGLCDLAREAYRAAAGLGPAQAGAYDNPAFIGVRSSRPDSRADARPSTRPDAQLDLRADPPTRAEALRCYAVLCRRQRRYAEAADAWQRILDLRRCPRHIAREATEALAVHHEHRLRDPRSARQFALRSLGIQASASRQHATRYRLARLERKLGGPTTDALQF